MEEIKKLFTETYKNNSWNMGSGESKSGLGSSLEYTKSVRVNLLKIIKDNNIKKIFDCSCGDWNWMREIKDNLNYYIGNDVVDEMIKLNNNLYSTEKIKFVCGDMVTTLKGYEDKYFDLIICRHTFEHLPSSYIEEALEVISKKTKYGLITNSSNSDNTELNGFNGINSRGINLNSLPYNIILNKAIDIFWDSVGEVYDVDKFEGNCTLNLFKF